MANRIRNTKSVLQKSETTNMIIVGIVESMIQKNFSFLTKKYLN